MILFRFFIVVRGNVVIHHGMKVLGYIDLLQVLQLESLAVLFTDVLALGQAVKVEDQMHEFLVGLVIVERNDGDAVIELIPEGVDSVVDDDEVLQVSVADDAKVLDVDALLRSDAVIAVEPVLYQAPVRVQVVKDDISIGLVAGCKDHHLVAFIGLLQAFQSVGPDVDASLNRFPIGESDLDLLIARVPLDVIDAMDESLIQVKDDGFLDMATPEGRQLHRSRLDIILGHWWKGLDILKRL